jgi:DNA-binding XRE family transcriptional regulator
MAGRGWARVVGQGTLTAQEAAGQRRKPAGNRYSKSVDSKSSSVYFCDMSEPKLQKALGAVIRKRRLSLKISQETLAENAKVHRTYIGSVERGERNLSLANIVGIAAALNCMTSELLHDAETLAVE